MEELLEKRARILDSLERTAVLIKQSEGEPDGYRAAYFLQEKDDEDPLSSSFLFMPPSSTHKHEALRLSDLGRHKCAQLFHCFDDDRDGVWSFEEFKAYLFVMRKLRKQDPLTSVIENPEMWSMYMGDAYETDAKGYLTLQGFFMYREATESPEESLTDDLIRFGMNWLWEGLERHIQLQALFDAYDVDKAGKLPLSKLQYLLGEGGIVDAVVILLHAHFMCMDAILQRNRAIRLFGYKQLSRVAVHDKDHIYRGAFVALCLSMWEPPPLPTWSGVVQRLNVHAFAAVRRMNATLRKWSVWMQRAATAGMLKANRLVKTVGDNRGDYVVKLDVGNEFAPRAEAHLSYTTDCDSSATLYELGYREDGAECFTYLDFLTRPDVTDAELLSTIHAMTKLIDLGMLETLRSLPHFLKYLVVSPSKTKSQGSSVVRVVFLFTEGFDPYHVLTGLGLPESIQFEQFLSRLRWMAMFNVTPEDMLTNKRFNLAKHIGVRSALTATVGRQGCGQIVKQMCYQAKYEAASRKVEDEIIHKEQEKHNIGTKSPHERDSRTAKAWTDQRKELENHAASAWRDYADRLASFFFFTKASTASINFNVASVTKIFHRDSVLHKLFHPDELSAFVTACTSNGGLSVLWKQWHESLKQELQALADKTAAPIPGHATPAFVQDYHIHKSVVAIYDTLVANVVGLNVVKAEAGTVGFTLLLEGFNVIPLLPRVTIPSSTASPTPSPLPPP
ncbi:Aste57867_14447 [Aphanomyces stellatus]|uniref:Aste57867_14447 protein n=1 Tax=Aphanomyces stellatus TaxID=120398 RepID=A0A485L1I1_9STRA|nr:hypothetical protein As57867_014393 [Aphanomyces stellatus]VFT91269.1 Aste57867_14447 [Aphanomyces stellatus]